MFAVFEKYLLNKADFTPADLAQIWAVTQAKSLHKREYLLRAGDVWPYQVFVSSGCLRTYTLDEKGAEHILNFAVENWWAGDQESLTTGQATRYNIDAIEESTVLLFKKEDFNQLRQQIPLFDGLINAHLVSELFGGPKPHQCGHQLFGGGKIPRVHRQISRICGAHSPAHGGCLPGHDHRDAEPSAAQSVCGWVREILLERKICWRKS